MLIQSISVHHYVDIINHILILEENLLFVDRLHLRLIKLIIKIKKKIKSILSNKQCIANLLKK